MTIRVDSMIGSQWLKTVKDICDKIWSEIQLLGTFDRVEILTDNYDDEHPIKQATRTARGQGGTKLSIDLTSDLPPKLQEFLQNDDNKSVLYQVMTAYFKTLVSELNQETVYVIVYGQMPTLGSVPSSTMIEVDYRLVLHIIDALLKGFNDVVVRANDTDVVIILMAFFPFLLSQCQHLNLKINHGIKLNQTLFNINNMCANHDMENCPALLFYHAFSGCDYVPSFYGHGKIQFCDEMVKNIDSYRETFTQLSQLPT